MLLYVDDDLAVYVHPKEALKDIYNYFAMKAGSIIDPKI